MGRGVIKVEQTITRVGFIAFLLTNVFLNKVHEVPASIKI